MDVTPVLNNEKQTADILDVQGLMETAIAIYNATFQDPNFMKLLRDPSEEFDAIIVELYELDIYNGYVDYTRIVKRERFHFTYFTTFLLSLFYHSDRQLYPYLYLFQHNRMYYHIIYH